MFMCIVHLQLFYGTLQELKKLIDQERQRDDLKNHDCFVMVMMSHGFEGKIISGYDSRKVCVFKFSLNSLLSFRAFLPKNKPVDPQKAWLKRRGKFPVLS